MKPAWLIAWAVALLLVAVWTFTPKTPDVTPVTDGKPYGSDEPYMLDARKLWRKAAMTALDNAWSSRCGETRKDFVAGVYFYYYNRQGQNELYPRLHGKPGADYIATVWSSADDKRIDRLTQEAYARGYLTPAEFSGSAGKLIAAIVKDERVIGTGCAG